MDREKGQKKAARAGGRGPGRAVRQAGRMTWKAIQARRAALALASIAVLSASVMGCSKKGADPVEKIREAGGLKVAIVETGSQYTHLEGEELTGTEPELVAYIAQALGVDPAYQVCSQEEALEALRQGEADIALGCINERSSLAEEYRLSTPYGKGYFYAVTKRGDYVLTAGALKDSLLGVEKNLDEETRGRLYQAEGIRVTDLSSPEAAADAIKAGEIRAYICYEEQAKALLADQDLQVQDLTDLEPEAYVIVAAKSDQTLISGIDVLIRQFLEAG